MDISRGQFAAPSLSRRQSLASYATVTHQEFVAEFSVLQARSVIRHHKSYTSTPERAILNEICKWVPAWLTSDRLTVLGVVGAALTGLGFVLAHRNIWFVCLSILGLVLNWLGDSLDGSIARFRSCERPQYGFFIDLSADSIGIILITLGIGFSPFAHLYSALIILADYYLLMIVSLSICLATGVFNVSYGKIGSTEIRLFIVACALGILAFPIGHWQIAGCVLTTYDCIMLAVALFMTFTAVREMASTARNLARIDPPRG